MRNESDVIKLEMVEKTINQETGEVLQEKTITQKRVGKEPYYVKLYLNDLLYLKDMPTGLSPILFALLQRMSFKNNIVINSSVKRQIALEVEKSFETINKSITQFVKGGILIREDVGMYLFNPYLFGKGDWSDIKEIRASITYNLNGRSFGVQTEKYHGGNEKI
jgi:hypothetical protein